MRKEKTSTVEASAEQMDLFERVFNSVHSLIAYLDCDFNFVRVNRAYAEANGETPDFFIGKNYFDLFPHRENESMFRRVVEWGEPHHVFEKSLELSGKEPVSYWDWSLEPVREGGGRITGVVMTLLDVTERIRFKEALRRSEETKEEILSDRDRVEYDRFRLAAVIEQVDEGTLEKQLRQAQKMESLGTLAGGIAHDLNNILMPIIMNAEMIEEDVDSDNPLHHYAQKILTSAQRGRDLVRRILNFSREKDEEKRAFYLVQSLKETIDLVRSTLPSTIEIKEIVGDDVGHMKGDPAQVQEVIVNLCTNAAHAIGMETGLIEVSVENVELEENSVSGYSDLSPGPYIKLSVSDTGVGMDDSLQERIFEPFFTTKKPSEGIGMGLAMVHGAIKRHSGAISVDSRPGEGTRFDIYFPRVLDRVPMEVEKLELYEGNGEHVFLVDDEEYVVEAMCKVLKRLGYTVTATTNANEALAVFRDSPEPFHVVILDFALPEMSGLELARKMTEMRPEVPIVLATGFAGAVDRDEMHSAGIDHMVNKPLTSREVGAVIRRVLDKECCSP